MAEPCKKRSCNNSKITIFIILLLTLTLFSSIFCQNYHNNVTYAAAGSAAIVIEQSSGRVLYAENPDAPLPIASTTKVLTALTVIDNVSDLDEKIKIPKNAVGVEGSSIYLKEGEELSFRELLYGLMLRSGNDAAVALAIGVSGDESSFVSLMNEKARECGAENCNFTNPHGLHDDSHLCTARGLGKITAQALSRPPFKEIVSTKSVKISGDPIRYLVNKNKMLSMYDGANGVKTGFTKKSGRCLVSSAERDGMELICVVLNHGDMWNDSMKMLNVAFARYKMHKITDGEQVFVNVEKGRYKKAIAAAESFSYPLSDEEYGKIKIETDLPDVIQAPVKNNEKIGEIRVYLDERLLFSSNFYTICDIKKKGL